MAKKSNIRSIRFSDEMMEIIESQPGETFTAKFEALVFRCIQELPKKEQELAGIQERIDYNRKQLYRIQQKAMDLENSMFRMQSTVEQYNRQVKQTINGLEKLIEEM